jgi:hypothetical protein
MTQMVRKCMAVAALLVLVSATTASAQIQVVGTTALPHVPRYDVAFDRVHQVYLLISDASPVSGQFLDVNGARIGGPFTIALEYPSGNPFTSWATVSFGGTPDDPAFLVTYLAVEGVPVRKYARLVRYRAGAAPTVSERLRVTDVNSEWYAAERSRTMWDGEQFIVTTRVRPPGSAFPTPQVQHVDLNGGVSAAVLLGDFQDYEGGPSIACAPNQVCMITGFAAGTPFGSRGGVFARLFNARTLQPIGALFYLDDHSTFMDNPNVVYNKKTGKFLAVWYRRTGSYIDSRLIATDGTMGPLDLSKSFGPGGGDISLAYNTTTQTSLLVTKWSAANNGSDLYAVELGDDGWHTGTPVRITPWDQKWSEYRSAVTASDAGPQWMVTHMLAANGWATVVKGTGDIVPPPPTSRPAMNVDMPSADQLLPAGRVHFEGWALDQGASTGPGVDAVHVWAYPSPGSGLAPVFLGVASYGGARTDVGAVFGPQFKNSGFSLDVAGLWPGIYDVAVFAHSAVTNTFAVSKVVRFTVKGFMMIDTPGQNALVGNYFLLGGWAYDGTSSTGSGIDAVHLWAYPNPGSGAPPFFVGTATLGVARPDVGAVFGSRFNDAGFEMVVGGLNPGSTYDLVASAHSSASNTFVDWRVTRVTVSTYVTIDTPVPNATIQGGSFDIGGWAVDRATTKDDTGVDAVDVWAYPESGMPVFLGHATYGVERSDVGKAFGDQRFDKSGYTLPVNSLGPGTYDIVVFARSTVTGTFRGAQVVRITR